MDARLYGVSFSVAPGNDAHATWAGVANDVQTNLEAQVSKRKGFLRPGRQSSPNADLASLEAEWPFNTRGTLLITLVRVLRSGTVVEVHVETRLRYAKKAVRPFYDSPPVPEFVFALARKHHLLSVDRPMECEPRNVHPHQVADFVQDELLNPNRQLPLVVLSTNTKLHETFIDADSLAADLAGLARIYVLPVQSSFSLSDAVGKQWGCYDGAARIYWANLDLKRDSLYEHPLYLADLILSTSESNMSVEKQMRRLIARTMLEHQDVTATEAAVKVALGQKAMAGLAAATKVEDLAAQVESLESEREWMQARVLNLESQLATRPQPSDVERHSVKGPTHWDLIKEARSADDVLRIAEKVFPRLRIWTSAWKKSAGYRTRHVEDILLALEVLDDLATDYYGANRQLDKPVYDYIRGKAAEKGRRIPKFSANESTTNMTLHGAHRLFRNGAESRQMEPHFTIGAGDSEGCCHLFWEFNDVEQSIDVGYLGPHLPYKAENS